MGDGLPNKFHNLVYGALPMLPYLTASEQEGERRPLTAKEMDTRSDDLLRLINDIDDAIPPVDKHQNVLTELLKSEDFEYFPRKDQIKTSVDEALELFDSHIRLAFYCVKKLRVFIGKFYIDKEDFEQICYFALWAACLTYDKSVGTKFSTWCYNVVRQVVIRDINRFYTRAGRIGQTIRLLSKDGDEVTLSDIEDYRELSIFDKILAHEILSNVYSKNEPRIGDILIERIVWDMTLDECAVKRRITGERIRQLEARGLQKLKALYHSGPAVLIH